MLNTQCNCICCRCCNVSTPPACTSSAAAGVVQKQAEALKLGIRAICYELNAPKDEIVELILKNQSVLHGRDMHLSVADIAHLAMLRQPTGRIAE
jgi:hypothetical protein